MSYTRVGLDVDGVLAAFYTPYENLFRMITGTDRFPSRAEFDPVPEWNWPRRYGYTDEETERVWQYIRANPDFWLDLRPMPSAFALVSRLNFRQIDLYFITDRPGEGVKARTEWWLQHHFYVGNPTVLISAPRQKGRLAEGLALDYFVEDRLENAHDVADAGTVCYLLDRPYNRVSQETPRPTFRDRKSVV